MHFEQETPPTPEQEREKRAREIANLGDYEVILSTFKSSENTGLLEEQTQRLRADVFVQRELRAALPHLQNHDFEMLTLLELFDRGTFEHCVRTYKSAHEKLESTGQIGVYLRSALPREGYTQWDIELACLLHDMGKISLTPKNIILNNALTDKDWHTLFLSDCEKTGDSSGDRVSQYEETLRIHPDLRPKDITPIKLGLSEEEQQLLTDHNIDVRQSLGTIQAKHQDISVEIAEHYYPESHILKLIGNHHERPLSENEPTPIAQSTVRLSTFVNTLRLADMFDAYHSARPYKGEQPLLPTLAFLIHKARAGFLDARLTRLWIQEDFQRHAPNFVAPLPPKEATALNEIESFLGYDLRRAA